MPGRGETKLLALDPAAHPYSTPSTVTPTLLGAMGPQQEQCEALGQGDRDVARADITELAGIGQLVALWETHQQRWSDWESSQEKGWSSVAGSTKPGLTGCPPLVSPCTAGSKPHMPGSQADPGETRELRQQSQG